MGNTVLSAQAPLWDVRALLQELPQFVYARSLGTAKFMKAVLCKSDGGPVVIKVSMCAITALCVPARCPWHPT